MARCTSIGDVHGLRSTWSRYQIGHTNEKFENVSKSSLSYLEESRSGHHCGVRVIPREEGVMMEHKIQQKR